MAVFCRHIFCGMEHMYVLLEKFTDIIHVVSGQICFFSEPFRLMYMYMYMYILCICVCGMHLVYIWYIVHVCRYTTIALYSIVMTLTFFRCCSVSICERLPLLPETRWLAGCTPVPQAQSVRRLGRGTELRFYLL